MNEWYMWLVTAASFIGTIANVRRQRWCFYIWAVTNATWTVYDVHKEAYPQAVLMAAYFCLSIWGIAAWRRKEH